MSDVLDKIVNCTILIDSPVENASSFSTILIAGAGPVGGGKDLKPVDRYYSFDEVMDAGWKEDSAIYKASRAAFLQDPAPEFIYIAVQQEAVETDENEEVVSGGQTPETGTEESGTETAEEGTGIAVLAGGGTKLETITETVKRVIGMAGWYGLALAGVDESDYDEVAQLIESTGKIFAYTAHKDTNPLSRKDYMRTFGIYSRHDDEYAHVSFMATCFSFSPGSETWEFKTLTGITPAELTGREMSRFDDANLSYYITCAGKNITRNAKMIGGEWIDVIRFADWLQNQMQIKIFELFVKNPKIPYTDSGITLVENQMRAVLQEGQDVGGIAETEYDENDEPVYGYTISVPKAASLTSAQRKSRKLPDCKFEARLAGAIHATVMRGRLVF